MGSFTDSITKHSIFCILVKVKLVLIYASIRKENKGKNTVLACWYCQTPNYKYQRETKFTLIKKRN